MVFLSYKKEDGVITGIYMTSEEPDDLPEGEEFVRLERHPGEVIGVRIGELENTIFAAD